MADIRLPLNVMNQSMVAGQLAEIGAAGPELQTVQILSTSGNTLVPGEPVTLVAAGANAVPIVDLATPGTDPLYGIVVFNQKVSSFVKSDFIQIAQVGAVIWLTSSTTLARGAKVGLNTSTFKLIAATPTNYIGQLLDVGATDTLARVELAIPIRIAPAS